MALPQEPKTSPLDDEAARRAILRRLNADNTPESLNAASSLASSVAPRSLAGAPSVMDQNQRAGERSSAPWQASGSQLEEMQKSIADTAAKNVAYKSGSPNTGTSGGLAGPSQARSTIGQADLQRNPLGLGATPSSLGATASAAVQDATGTSPLGDAIRRRLGSAPLSDEGQRALGVAPNSAEVQSALGAAPVGQQKAPTGLPLTQTSTSLDDQRVGERSRVPAYDMDALRAEAARRAADANAANAANAGAGATTTGSIVRPPQPPTQPPTMETKPPTPPDDTSISDAFTKMFQGQGDQFFDATGDGAGTGGGQRAGAGGGLIDQSGAGNAGGSAQLQQQLSNDLSEISQILAAGVSAPDVGAIFATQGRTILEMLDREIRDMESEGATIDPATANTLAVLREELDRQLKATVEQLNSRGIAESGIRIEAEQLLRRGNLSDQARILAERLSRVQDNIRSLRSQKINVAGDFGMAGANAQTRAEEAERNRLDDLRGMRLQGRTTLLNNQTQIEQAQAARDFTTRQNELERQSAMAHKLADLAAKSNDAAAEREWKTRQAELDREMEQNLSAAVTARASARGSASGAGGGDNTQAAIDDMFNTFATTEEAMSALDNPSIIADLRDNGVDIEAVYEAAQGLGHRRAGLSSY